MYTLDQFMTDVAPVIGFDVLKKLNQSGHSNTEGDDYVTSGPQYFRRVLKLAVDEAKNLVSAGLPKTAEMDLIHKYMTTSRAVEIWNRENVLATVSMITACAK
jgi:hypothetical protein